MPINSVYDEYKSNLLAGNREVCINITQRLLDLNIPVKDLYLGLFQRSLYEVGDLWAAKKISVAIEHVCTSITEGLISLTYPKIFKGKNNGKKVVVACTPGENHQVGAKLVADYFELHGWNSYFVGANTPYFTLAEYLTVNTPDLLAVSMSVDFHFGSLNELLKNVSSDFPDLKVIIGGAGFNEFVNEVLETSNNNNIKIIKTLDELEKEFFDNSMK